MNIPHIPDIDQIEQELLSAGVYSDDLRETMARVLEIYVRTGLWSEVHKSQIISKQSLALYQSNPAFKLTLRKLLPILVKEGEDTIVDIMRTGKEHNKLRAAEIVISNLDPETWDAGIRRERARVTGDVVVEQVKRLMAQKAQDPFGSPHSPAITAPDETLTPQDVAHSQKAPESLTTAKNTPLPLETLHIRDEPDNKD